MTSITSLIIIGGLFIFFWLPHETSKTSVPKQGNMSDVQDWNTYIGTKTGISFKYPKGLTVNVIGESDYADKPESMIDKVLRYTLFINETSIDYEYAHAETNGEITDNLYLSIDLTDYAELSWAIKPISLSDYKDAVLVKSTTDYRYVLFSHVDQWGSVPYLAQCDKSDRCIAAIKRANSHYPFMMVSISTVEGWRAGGAIIDLKSSNYSILKSVIASLSF